MPNSSAFTFVNWLGSQTDCFQTLWIKAKAEDIFSLLYSFDRLMPMRIVTTLAKRT